MSREIKFRAWHIEKKIMLSPWTIWKSNLLGYEDSCCLNLMQYTGLKDKNGVEIYEGDIVTSDSGVWDSGEVIFRHTAFRVHGFVLLQLKNIEVIGNIHESLVDA